MAKVEILIQRVVTTPHRGPNGETAVTVRVDAELKDPDLAEHSWGYSFFLNEDERAAYARAKTETGRKRCVMAAARREGQDEYIKFDANVRKKHTAPETLGWKTALEA